MKILITGASSGIGYCVAKYLLSFGFDLVLVSKDKSDLDKLFSEYKDSVITYGCDLTDEEECLKLYDRFKNDKIDIITNNA